HSVFLICHFFFSSRRRHTRSKRDWSSDVCSCDLIVPPGGRCASKFRFDVEAHRPPGGTISSFIPRHILHPASRHSKPASLNILRSEERRVGKASSFYSSQNHY